MSGRTHDVSISGFDLDRLEAELAKALRERDEALAKIERQAERIRYLEGATNHACGTPLTIALSERDEAREDADSWKVEYEIVAARLRGEKHPRDNEIISENEIIPKLIRERDEAREALQRLADCDWVITPHDRMDAVRKIARKALGKMEVAK